MIRRIARPLLGSIFIYGGYQTLRNPDYAAQASESLVQAVNRTLPDSPWLPTDARTWARANAGVQLGGGALLATGRFPRAASLALAGSLVPTTLVGHQFWNETDPVARQQQTTQFLKNASLLGGLIIAGFDTEGKPGVVWRTKRAAESAADRASSTLAAITPGAETASNELSERAHDWADTAHEKLTEAAEKAAPVVSEVAATAAGVAATAADRARSLRDAVEEKAPVVAERAAEKARALRGIEPEPSTLRERVAARLHR